MFVLSIAEQQTLAPSVGCQGVRKIFRRESQPNAVRNVDPEGAVILILDMVMALVKKDETATRASVVAWPKAPW